VAFFKNGQRDGERPDPRGRERDLVSSRARLRGRRELVARYRPSTHILKATERAPHALTRPPAKTRVTAGDELVRHLTLVPERGSWIGARRVTAPCPSLYSTTSGVTVHAKGSTTHHDEGPRGSATRPSKTPSQPETRTARRTNAGPEPQTICAMSTPLVGSLMPAQARFGRRLQPTNILRPVSEGGRDGSRFPMSVWRRLKRATDPPPADLTRWHRAAHHPPARSCFAAGNHGSRHPPVANEVRWR
jgi:hypothetical protein